ncbi:MAG: hypothetical protein J7577_13480 [Sphingobacteriaceae bacterium]|nr:hypothetical protein [Sphingobacteriaceae bacterium]
MSEMHLVNNGNRLPGGYTKLTGEFYIDEGELWLSYQKAHHTFDNFPEEIKTIIREDMEANPAAVAELIDNWGLLDERSQTIQYLACRYGAFDGSPDIIDGKLQAPEHVSCGRRETCKSQGKLCGSIQLKYGNLTIHEVRTLTEVGNGLLDKEIADKYNISQHTVRHQKDSICRKSGIERKPAMVGLAYMLGLVKVELR